MTTSVVKPRLEHDLGELAPRLGVEVGRRLVEHEQRRVHRQHRARRHPAALAEAEVVGRAPGVAGHPDRVQRRLDPVLELMTPISEVGRAEGDVVADGGGEELVVGVLEHDPDPAADLAQVGLLDPQAVDDDAAGAAAERAVEVQDEGRLAGAVGAEDRDPLAAGDGEVHAEQRLVPVRIGERQVADLEHDVAHGVTTAVRQISVAASGAIIALAHSSEAGAVVSVAGSDPP